LEDVDLECAAEKGSPIDTRGPSEQSSVKETSPVLDSEDVGSE
jgi:hypothetical protein